MGWGQQCRIRHVTSGRYLSAMPDNTVMTVHRQKADEASTAFTLLMSKVILMLMMSKITLILNKIRTINSLMTG